jgi:uncharacterized protein YjbI with pentapeptide repeats
MLKHLAIIAACLALMSPLAAAQSEADIAKATAGHSCADCNLFQADMSYAQIQGVTFAGARLRQSNMTLATLDRVNFDRANMSIANLYGGRFTGASFKNTDLSRAILVGGSYDGADFSGANLTDANISGAEMAKSRGLTQSQLNDACGDSYTRLPTGLSVQQCR